MALKFAITNLAGQQIAVVTDYDQGLVTIPYNDSRTAEVTLHPESPAGLKLGEEDNGAGVAQRAHTSKDGETETTTTKISRNLASRIKYGNYVKWDPGGDTEGETTLKGKTQAILLAYSEPPQNFSFSPRSDESQRFFYGTHFMEGDVISCAAHFGGLRIWLPGYISEVRLRPARRRPRSTRSRLAPSTRRTFPDGPVTPDHDHRWRQGAREDDR
jgi:hypothetical protein